MVSSLANAGIFTILLFCVLIKIRGKVFLGLGLLLWLFVIFFIARGFTDTFKFIAFYGEKKPHDIMLNKIADLTSTLFSRIKWFVLYFFVIQAQEVRIKLQSASPEEFNLQSSIWRRKKYFILSVFFFASIVIVASTFLNFTNYQGEQNYIFEMLSKVAILLIDVYFTYIFIELLKFHTN